jgi:predicted protein tyrosine phosphatase
MKVLFVCNQNIHRSKTAEQLFKGRFETRSAGLFNDTPLDEEKLKWADIVAVMEDRQRKEIAERFPSLYLRKKIVCLDIPDMYHYNQPELIRLLNERVERLT